MNKVIIIVVLFVSVMAFGQDVEMNISETNVFKTQVLKASKEANTITSDFVQYKHLDFLDNDIETFGRLQFKTPGLVKWEYTKPYAYSVVFKEEQLLINDGGTKNAVDIGSSAMFKKLNQLIINSVKGDMFSDDDFTVTYFKTGKEHKAIFVPKDTKMLDYIASFELLFDKKDGAVLEVKMVEPSQDYTQIVFSNRKVNAPIDDSVFTQ